MDPADLLPRCTFPPAGTPVTCGVSGGPDSTALLVLAVEAGCRATAVHVDHCLRERSAEEADVVRALADKVGAAFESVTAPVDPGPNLEARARNARRDALPPDALLGHTADDQAETVLLNLVRGSGLDGLAGMRRDRRPILALRRSETRELCRTLGLTTVDDPMNDDPAYRRNRMRAEVVHLLDDIAERDTVPLLARQADLVREATDHLAELACDLDPTDARGLAGAPPALARLAIRAWLREVDPEQHPPDAAAVARVLSVARHEILATEIAGGWRVARTEGRLRLEPVAPTT